MTATLTGPYKDRSVLIRGSICAIGFGGFALWGSLAPMDEGIAAAGAVVVEDRRQVIQHLEGGIVTELAVSEGDHVKRGQTLLVLSKSSSGSERDQLLSQLGYLEATIARLTAMRENRQAIDFNRVAALQLSPAVMKEIEAKENDLFRQARDGLRAELSILAARRSSALSVSDARAKQMESAQRGLDATTRRLATAKEQFAKRMVRSDQVESLEREVADLEADLARLESERLEAAASAADFGGQVAQRRIEWQQKAAEDLVAANAELNNKRQALGAAEDVLARTVITSPMDGEVLNLAVSTIGGVVRSGETLMEVVPQSAGLVASVQVPPAERAAIKMGQEVRTQLVAYKGWQVPQLTGTITGVSADLKVDAATQLPYYEARILISADEADKLKGAEASPGMPVQVFIFSGARRTLFEQIGQPIFESWFRGMRQL
jgi:HlyD family type I secretion membrane fusion protein